MEALCTYDSSGEETADDESVEEGSTSQKPVQVQAVATVRKSKLPSAAELLSKSHKAAFLAHARDPPLDPEASIKQTEPPPTPHVTSQGPTPPSIVDDTTARDKYREELARSELKKHPLSAQPQEGKGDTNTAKERVKRQRLKGQAGIGSDFRTWKSDEEMRMRQQFDT